MTATETARTLAPRFQARGDEIEEARRLPDDLVESLRDSGLFRLCVPAAYGGLEADVFDFVGAIEALSYADGSSGWCVMIGATTGMLSASLTPEHAKEIYGDPRGLTVGVMVPGGRGEPEGDGFRVTGRWSWGSGGVHGDWIVGRASVPGEERVMFFPRAEVEILDTWYPPGLRGTASNDFRVEGVLVPLARSVLIGGRPVAQGPLYTFSTLAVLGLGVCAVPLGLARRAFDEFVTLASTRRPFLSDRILAERAVVQREVAEAEAALRSARVWVDDCVSTAWETASRGERLDRDARADLRLAAVNATWQSVRAIDLLYHAAGGAVAQDAKALARCFRDVHVATQHAMVGERVWEQVGRVRLGLETPPAF